jgi:peptide/nickel transport system permease protein
MHRYLISRLAQIIIVVFTALSINFVLIHLIPGDPTSMILGRHASASDRDRVRKEMGLDRPLATQYLEYFLNVLKGDMGNSYRMEEPVLKVVLATVPNTLMLAGSAFILSLVIGVLLGTLTAVRVGTWFDGLVNSVAILGFSVPVFWIGIILILVFSLRFHLLPTQGMVDVRMNYSGVQYWLDLGKHLILPVTALTLESVGSYVRMMRSSMLEVLGEDYIRTARSKGLSEQRVIFKHAASNASMAVLTLMGLKLGYLLTSSVMVEIVFAWPGTGRLLYDAMFARDYPLMLGSFFIVTIMVALGNLIADFTYAIADPRIRFN